LSFLWSFIANGSTFSEKNEIKELCTLLWLPWQWQPFLNF
jgi:hypothetical protein